jgi:hypothetical protein
VQTLPHRAWSELRLARKGLFARHPLIRRIMSLAGAGGLDLDEVDAEFGEQA